MSWLAHLSSRKSRAIDEPVFSGELPSDPGAIVRAFVADYERWNAYAWAISQADPLAPQVERSYNKLVTYYCGPAEQPQLPAYGSVATFSPGNCTPGQQTGEGEICTVPVTVRDHAGYDTAFEFDFVRAGDGWLLEEVYYLDEFENNARLKYL